MLVLTRKLGEMIEIGDNIKLKLEVRIDGKQVRLGIEAPARSRWFAKNSPEKARRILAPRESR